jgi:channel protein (hemolysin III family)
MGVPLLVVVGRPLASPAGLGLGWAVVVVTSQLIYDLGAEPFTFLVACGVTYTVGANVFAWRRQSRARRFGYHEICQGDLRAPMLDTVLAVHLHG